MSARRHRQAFTLIELLVVVAIIALLISILLPSLAAAREQGKKAKCLANMRSIAQAMNQYAADDKAEQTIPIMQPMLVTEPYWVWRTVNWFAWGGRSGQKVFLIGASNGYLLRDPDVNDPPPAGATLLPIFDAKRRPLTRFILNGVSSADTKKVEWFHCPSDTGYPNHALIDDSPPGNALRPCYDTLGSSYRGSQFSLTYASGGAPNGQSQGVFALGPWGHRMSTLQNTGRLILFGEPSFFNMIGQDNGVVNPPEVVVTGWHKKRMMDNLGFVDGSARTTRAEGHITVDGATAVQMRALNQYISRGPTWMFDCYPTPGARIWGNQWRGLEQAQPGWWPYARFQDQMRVP